MSQSVSEVNGITSYTVNRGTLTNQGLDLTLNFTPINRLTEVNGEIKGFRWRFDPSLGSVINQLIDKAVQTPETTLKHDNEIYYSEYLNGTIHVVGRPINGFYSYRFTGLDGKDGRPTFDNFSQMVTVTDPQTGEQTEITRAKWLNEYFDTNQQRYMTVMSYSGTRVPTIQGSLRNTFTYNNFTLSVNLAYSLGSKIRLTKLYPNVSGINGTIAPLPTENVRREWASPLAKGGRREVHQHSGHSFRTRVHGDAEPLVAERCVGNRHQEYHDVSFQGRFRPQHLADVRLFGFARRERQLPENPVDFAALPAAAEVLQQHPDEIGVSDVHRHQPLHVRQFAAQRTGPDHLGRLCDRRVDPSDLLVYAQCLILKYSPL